ncbi:hypothetical protein [[Phormidium] sp. ETS-05]|uniref:hypothetical protein n=1 Tax=[Phormidium] sp. ETS-05 TaxID=222819 RepID=UPI0018EF3006|nr:hypothetical protein [[Phormidium] sp. ETS-05]
MWEDWKDLKKRQVWIASLKAIEGLKKEPHLSPKKGILSQETIEVIIDCAEKQSKTPWTDYRIFYNLDPNINQQQLTNAEIENQVRVVVCKKFSIYMKHNPDIEPTEEVKRRFIQRFIEPGKQGFVTDWLHIEGVEHGLTFLESWEKAN